MTQFERQIRTARSRLWLNRWFYTVTFCAAVTGGLLAITVLMQRLFDWPLPLTWVGVGLALAATIASIAWMWVTREDDKTASARLDEAAGLRERLSSAYHCARSGDPFARAVVADAEITSGSLSARQHIRLTVPSPLGWSVAAYVAAAAMFLITPGLLATPEVQEQKENVAAVHQAKLAVKRKMDRVRQIVEANPAIAEIADDLDPLDPFGGGRLDRPNDIRHAGIKKLDSLADAVKQKREDGEYDHILEMRKMFRGLKAPKATDAPTQKLTNALLKGDFKTAREEMEKLKEQLATLKSDQDKELVEKMSKQLEELAKQLNKLSIDKKLAEKIKQAGIKEKDIERLLENLKKEDLEQLKKELQKRGLTEQQAQKLANKLQQRQNAGSAAKKLAQNMSQGAKGVSSGQIGEAMAGLSAAADQLGELEKLEQEMNQLDAALAELQDAKNDLDKSCGKCGGTGMRGGKRCSACQGSGQGNQGGMGKLGKGRGGLAQEKKTDVAFKTERGKVHTGKGTVIGQFLVEGEQVKGETRRSVSEVVIAGEQEASDRINRNRIPRQYHKAVKTYFSNVRRSIKDADLKPPEPKSSPDTQTPDTPKDATGDDSDGR